MTYRPEVDGLRALAVLPVILFHAGFPLLSGGFVGVDVFFVISGYLITSIILTELSAGTFSLIHFWERRARRILPALFVVLLACLPMAWFWLSPQDLLGFSESLLAVALFGSNVWFWRTSGYFDTAAEFKPLLHTWSLAVEEQYYLCFPLLTVMLWRLRRTWLAPALLLSALFSLGLAEWGAHHIPAFTFYMLPTRAWELLLGALVAWYLQQRPATQLSGGRVQEAASLSGLLLIVTAMVSIDENTVFPGLTALLPAGGTALILLFAHPRTLIGRVLGHRALTSVGLISYSAYLWHQPLFAFARHRTLETPSVWQMAGWSTLALLLAYVTWRYVEAPFRQKQRFSSRQIFLSAAAGSAFFVVIGVLGTQQKLRGHWQQQHPQLVNTEPAVRAAPFRACPGITLHGGATCKLFGHGSKRVVLWGDSHASRLAASYPGLRDTELYVIVHGGCPPVVGVRRFDDRGNAGSCDRLDILQSYADYISALKPALVLLSARWTLYLQGLQRHGELQPAHHFLSTAAHGGAVLTAAARAAMLERQLTVTIKQLTAHAPAVVINQHPDYAAHDFRQLERGEFSVPRAEMEAWHQAEIAIMRQVATLPRTTVLDSKALFCDRERCRTRDKGVLLYMDVNHLSAAGAARVWQRIRQVHELSAAE